MSLEALEKDYVIALENLASALGLKYEEIAGFCGGVADGGFGARRLKEFFRTPEVSEMLDKIACISEEYHNELLQPKTC